MDPKRHTTDEIIERAVAEGVPVAPVSNGRTVLELDHAAARDAWVDCARRRLPHAVPARG